jgi:hypothetical protein
LKFQPKFVNVFSRSLARSNGVLSSLFLLPNLAVWLVHLKVKLTVAVAVAVEIQMMAA